MLVLAACVIALLSPVVVGKWPAGLLLRRWRWPLLVWLALAIQIVIIEFGAPDGWAPVLHVSTYVLASAFVWLNRSVLGIRRNVLGLAGRLVIAVRQTRLNGQGVRIIGPHGTVDADVHLAIAIPIA